MKKALVLTLFIGLMTCGIALAQTTHYVYPGDSIQAAIDAASNGDKIIVKGGSYPEKLTVNKAGLILMSDGTYPVINPEVAGYYDAAIIIQADDVTISGFEIMNSLGAIGLSGEQCAIWDGSWTLGPSGLTVNDCIIHDIQHGVRSYGPNLTVTNCEMYRLRRSGVHASGPYQNQPMPLLISNNWFHDWVEYYKEQAGVFVKYDSRVGEVTNNYISGIRMGIAYYYGGPKAAYGQQIIFAHNTIDMNFDLGGGPVDMTIGISFWGTGQNADAVIVRDNIFANARWYAVYQEGATISGSFSVDNNLFYNNYWFYWPDYQYPVQWFGDDSRAQAGWTSGDSGFNFTDNFTNLDPLFALVGMSAHEQWALDYGSPALNSASDGTHIGAWQGEIDIPSISESIIFIKQNILHKGTANSLVAMLEAALEKIEMSMDRAAVNILQAFVQHVKAQSGKHITEAMAQELVEVALAWIEDLDRAL